MINHSLLTPEQVGQIREELVRVLAKLERRIDANGARPTELDQACVGRLSRIEALQNRGLTQNLRERERVQLAGVLDALRRIEEGSYGICCSCAEPIPVERLQIFPETRCCTDCSA